MTMTGPFKPNRKKLVPNVRIWTRTLRASAPRRTAPEGTPTFDPSMVDPSAVSPRPAPPQGPTDGLMTSGRPQPNTRLLVQSLARESEDLRRHATLSDARADFERLYEEHGRFLDRVSALSATELCPADDLTVQLDELARYWFAPDVADALYRQIDQLGAALAGDAASIAADIDADPVSLSDATQPAAVILRERISGLRRRVADALKEVRGLFAGLTTAHAQIRHRLEGLERSVQAIQASGLDHGQLDAGCVTYCRKIHLDGRGDGYLTLSRDHLIFQPVRTSGILLWRSDHVGRAEVTDVSYGLTLTDLRRPLLGAHRVTLRQARAGGASFQLALGREALDDLLGSVS
jgi:hypothetical protein